MDCLRLITELHSYDESGRSGNTSDASNFTGAIKIGMVTA